jgi:methylmalonyl-CoA mutase
MANYQPKNKIRVVTAAALFDGHDAAINIVRRILQDHGAEVIHLGHNRSVQDVVRAVLQEGAQGVCISSYQGGHMEYFKYMRDLLVKARASYVKIFGGGGGVIIHEEKKELEAYGISQIFHPDDGRRLGLDGMIEMIMRACDFDLTEAAQDVLESLKNNSSDPESNLLQKTWGHWLESAIEPGNPIPSKELGVLITALDQGKSLKDLGLPSMLPQSEVCEVRSLGKKPPMVLGITGTGGAGKSSLIDELVQRFLNFYPDKKIAVVCVDPSKKKTGGALLGDRIRMNSLERPRVFMRSLASRQSGKEIAESLPRILNFLRQGDFDLILAETSGIGQGSSAILEVSDFSLYVMTAEFGAQSQLEKIDMIDFADFVAINKSDRRGAEDALRDVTKQYKRARKIFDGHDPKSQVQVPVFLTQAARFNDPGVHSLFFAISEYLHSQDPSGNWQIPPQVQAKLQSSDERQIIPPHRQNYLAEIVQTIRNYKHRTKELAQKASVLGAIHKVKEILKASSEELDQLWKSFQSDFSEDEWEALQSWQNLISDYKKEDFIYQVRHKEIRQPLRFVSLSGSSLPRVAVPQLEDWGDRVKFLREENVPGQFPFTAGVFPLKRQDEDPKRMFAGEGPPERTNKRFHFLCEGEKAHRLSTAFDSVTLYGHDPDLRPDIFGKVGESGVSICTLEDMKRLYEGFDLISPNTSVSMTINGPAPMILAFFFNAAIDQQVEKKEKELGRKLTSQEWEELSKWTLQQVRGTVQADILKEDQGQNTCIFSIQFALKMMGDIQEYFTKNQIRNFYSVSISGYHIAEAGANPISQLAFTLSNGFTFVEYYKSRGLKVDEFAPNLSFFFSNGLDPEYIVIGRVARRIWAIAMRDLYAANERSQKLKYHIQTSGRSLHAQEIAFNDIRTTLQALIAIADHCNSLHTNAYDEAITTPTEESVRRAMAIQLIINRELGLTKNENPLQGSFFLQELTELVEEAVLDLFLKINERGGVLGAMETQFQRSKIQEESLYYETLKHEGKIPIIGVNSFVDPKTLAADFIPKKIELARASFEEKSLQLKRVNEFQKKHASQAQEALANLKDTVLRGEKTSRWSPFLAVLAFR